MDTQLPSFTVLAIALVFTLVPDSSGLQSTWSERTGITELPPPRLDGSTSIEKCLSLRRSVRTFQQNDMLALDEVSQLLWSAQGVTSNDGLRTAPSAGAVTLTPAKDAAVKARSSVAIPNAFFKTDLRNFVRVPDCGIIYSGCIEVPSYSLRVSSLTVV